MTRRLNVRHTTIYRYAHPVQFGPHRMMFRPRDSHDMRLVATKLKIMPTPVSVQWSFDVFGNSVATAHFDDRAASELHFESAIDLVHYQTADIAGQVAAAAATYPFAYLNDDLPDLQSTMARHRPDPNSRVAAWASQFVEPGQAIPTMTLLKALMEGTRQQITYRARHSRGTQDPAVTLDLGTGSCRDFALLMMEAVRSLGFAARFVTGYIYSPEHKTHHSGGGATHAWMQVYLPGAGWVEFDPTNGIVGNRDLIRVAVTRDPAQAIPLSGTYKGTRSGFLGMAVTVIVQQGEHALAASGSEH